MCQSWTLFDYCITRSECEKIGNEVGIEVEVEVEVGVSHGPVPFH